MSPSRVCPSISTIPRPALGRSTRHVHPTYHHTPGTPLGVRYTRVLRSKRRQASHSDLPSSPPAACHRLPCPFFCAHMPQCGVPRALHSPPSELRLSPHSRLVGSPQARDPPTKGYTPRLLLTASSLLSPCPKRLAQVLAAAGSLGSAPPASSCLLACAAPSSRVQRSPADVLSQPRTSASRHCSSAAASAVGVR